MYAVKFTPTHARICVRVHTVSGCKVKLQYMKQLWTNFMLQFMCGGMCAPKSTHTYRIIAY